MFCSAILTACSGDSGRVTSLEASIEIVDVDASVEEVLSGSRVELRGASSLSPGWVARHQWTQISGIPITGTSGRRTDEFGFTAPEVDEPTEIVIEYQLVSNDRVDAKDIISLRVVPAFTLTDGELRFQPFLTKVLLSRYESYPKDSAGVIMHPAGQGNGYHPGVVARYAALLHQEWLESGDDHILQRALVNSDWLADGLDCRDHKGLWLHSWSKQPYADDPGWGSAMTNGYGATALVQLAQQSDRKQLYLERAKCAIGPFAADVENDGVRTRLDTGVYWYEEIASGVRGGHLNGMMFSLAGLYLTWKNARSADARRFFDSGLAALKSRLPDYDAGFASRYDILVDDVTGRRSIATNNYNAIHINQLLWLFHVTGDRTVLDFADRFLMYDRFMIRTVRLKTTNQGVGAGIRVLDDGVRYGGFHQEKIPVTLRLEFRHAAVITHLVFFMPGELDEFPAFELLIPGNNGSAKTIPRPEQRRYVHESGGKLTTIFVIDISDLGYETDVLDVNFFEATHGGSIRLREIGVHYDDGGQLIMDRYDDLRTRKDW